MFIIILCYYFEHKTLTSFSVFITRTNCMKSSSVLILMQPSSSTFSTPSTVTVSIFSCKVILKKKEVIPIYVQHCLPHTKVSNKAQSTTNSTKSKNKSTKKKTLNYQTWKFTVWKSKLITNFRKSGSWWLWRVKGLIHFWQTHNFCQTLSCDWSFLYSTPRTLMQDSTAAIQSADST